MLNEKEYQRKDELFKHTAMAAELFAHVNDCLFFECRGGKAGFAGTVKYKDFVCFADCRIDREDRTARMTVYPGITVLPPYRSAVKALLKHIEITYNPDSLTLTLEDNQVAVRKTCDFSERSITESEIVTAYLALYGYIRIISGYISKIAAGCYAEESFTEFISPYLKAGEEAADDVQ